MPFVDQANYLLTKYDSDMETIKSNAEKSFAKNAAKLNLNGEFLGKKFNYNGVEYTVIGLKDRIRKLPVLAITENGKLKAFAIESVATPVTTRWRDISLYYYGSSWEFWL